MLRSICLSVVDVGCNWSHRVFALPKEAKVDEMTKCKWTNNKTSGMSKRASNDVCNVLSLRVPNS